MKIKNDIVVCADFTMKNDKGEILDSSKLNGDLIYIQGADMIFDKLEEALLGKEVGYTLEITLSPEDSYGVRDEELKFEFPKSDFAEFDKLEKGMDVEIETEEGVYVMTIIDIKDEIVYLDGNHPLVDEKITYNIKIKDLREATTDELEENWVEEF